MLKDVMTLEEAAELWNKSTDSLRQSCISRNGNPPRFIIGEEAQQSKRIWLVTKQGMERIYGRSMVLYMQGRIEYSLNQKIIEDNIPEGKPVKVIMSFEKNYEGMVPNSLPNFKDYSYQQHGEIVIITATKNTCP